MKNLSLKNLPVKDEIFEEALAIPSQISSAFEIASGSGTKYVLGNILKIDELCDNSAQQIWAENQYLQKQPFYVIELEFWELESEQLDWCVSQLFYTKYRILVSEDNILKNEVVTGPGEFSWLDIEELEEHYIAIDDEQIPEEVFPQLTSIILEHFHEDYGTDDYVSNVIEPMLEETNSDEAEKELISSVCRPLRSEFKKFITSLKQQVKAEREVRARHPIWDPDTVHINDENLTTFLTMYSWNEQFHVKASLTKLPTNTNPAQIFIEIYSRHRNRMGTREVLQGDCFFDLMVNDSYSSAEQFLDELFSSGLLENEIWANFAELLVNASH